MTKSDHLMTTSAHPLPFMGLTNFLSLAILVLAASAVSWDATPFNPASVPLAVRSPYLSAWLPQGAGTALNGAWPQFWTGSVSFEHRTSLNID
jgi:hypothetical protein